MDYNEQDDRRGLVWGIISVVLYAALCVGVMFITYRISLPEPESGVLIDFGVSEAGGGEDDLALSEQDTSPAAPEPEPPTESDPVMTSDMDDAPEVAPSEPEPVTRPEVPQPAPEPVREVNRQALFPGRTEGSTATSQGASSGEGNQGSQDGAPDGANSAGGAGVEGFSLEGRKRVGNWPDPKQGENWSGRVVIRVDVNRDGKVISAVYQEQGSTTNIGDIVSAARDAAWGARFDASESEIQTGTITYIFRLN